ncbi:Nicotinamide/nicotinic acid mononucleotide adenylyltransferase 1 [Paecilomyces lecythidis]
MASDFARMNTEFEVVGGYLSPVSDAYEKTGLVGAVHRIHMCQLAVQTSKWINTDPWEAIQPDYLPTAKVLDHFEYEINSVLGGIEDASGKRAKARIALLAGADLIETMSSPDLWTETDLQHILGDFGVFVVERAGTDLNDALNSLKKWEHNIHRIPQVVPNEISSTKIRNLVQQRMSVEYLIPKGVIEYVEENGLYMDEEKEDGGSGDERSERMDGRK